MLSYITALWILTFEGNELNWLCLSPVLGGSLSVPSLQVRFSRGVPEDIKSKQLVGLTKQPGLLPEIQVRLGIFEPRTEGWNVIKDSRLDEPVLEGCREKLQRCKLNSPNPSQLESCGWCCCDSTRLFSPEVRHSVHDVSSGEMNAFQRKKFLISSTENTKEESVHFYCFELDTAHVMLLNYYRCCSDPMKAAWKRNWQTLK